MSLVIMRLALYIYTYVCVCVCVCIHTHIYNRIQMQLTYYQAILNFIILIAYIADKELLQLSMEKKISAFKEEIDKLKLIHYQKEGIN